MCLFIITQTITKSSFPPSGTVDGFENVGMCAFHIYKRFFPINKPGKYEMLDITLENACNEIKIPGKCEI